MGTYDYHRPDDLASALALAVAHPEARFIAGGTDLMVRIREGRVRPPALISLRNVVELSEIDLGDGDGPTRIGAGVTVGHLLAHADLVERYPLLAAAARRLGSVQIRNAATIGGNLCNASPCADLALPLLAHEATLIIGGPGGERRLSLEDFFVAAGETRLRAAEVVEAIEIPAPPANAHGVFAKKGRVAMDISIASVAVLVVLRDGVCDLARIAAGSVAARPLRLAQAERGLEGQPLDRVAIERATAAARDEVRPISDVRSTADYRRHLVGVYVARALEQITAAHARGAASAGGGK